VVVHKNNRIKTDK